MWEKNNRYEPVDFLDLISFLKTERAHKILFELEDVFDAFEYMGKSNITKAYKKKFAAQLGLTIEKEDLLGLSQNIKVGYVLIVDKRNIE